MSHTGNFTSGVNGVYTIVVSNTGGTASSGPIAVSDTLSSSEGNNPVVPYFEFVSATGTGWSCSTYQTTGFPFDFFYVGCISASVIAAGASAPPITLTVIPTIIGTVTNEAGVGATLCPPSFGCDVHVAFDPTIVVAAVPTLPEWAMIALSTLLALAGVTTLRRRTNVAS
jgi:uncharacterized repeat protein (TIGR01451 family)